MELEKEGEVFWVHEICLGRVDIDACLGLSMSGMRAEIRGGLGRIKGNMKSKQNSLCVFSNIYIGMYIKQ